MIDADGGNKCDDGDAAPSLSVMCVHGSGGPGSKRKDGVSVCARLYVNHFVRVFFIAMPVAVGHSSIHVPRFLSLSKLREDKANRQVEEALDACTFQ